MMRAKNILTKLRSVFTRYINEVGTTNLFLLFVLAMITLYPLFSGGFTTHDDAYVAITTWSGHIWEMTKTFSTGQGRFNFLWSTPVAVLPYIIDNHVWYIAIKFGSIFLLLGALYYAVLKLFRSRWIALASLAFFLAIIQNGWEHNALTSFPFGFNLFAALFLVSLGLFATAIDRNNLALAGLSGVLYFFALGTELFVLFFSFYIAVLLSRVTPGESILKRLKSGINYILAIAIPLLAYLVIYLVWRHIYPSDYDGNALDGFNLSTAAKVIATYSLSAFPLASLHFYSALGDPLPFTNLVELRAFLSELNVVSFIKLVVAGFLFARLITTANFVVPRARTLLIGAVLALIGIFLPNLLLGFTLRHQGWVASGYHSYVYTYYSFISAVVFLALLLAYANVKSRSWHPKLRLAVISTIVVGIMVISFAVEARNQYIAFDQKLAHRKWQLMDVVIKSPAFMEILDGSTVVAPTLFSNQRGTAMVNADDWSNYVKYKTGKNVQFGNAAYKSGEPCCTLVFRQEPGIDNQFIILEKINQSDSPVSTELTIYSMPVQARPVVMGSFISGEIAPKLEINGESMVDVGAGVFSSNFPGGSDDGFVQTARVTGNVDFIPERITISNYSVEPHLRSLSAELADGIDFRKQDYPDFLAEVSGMSGQEPWGRWTDGSVAKFRFRQSLPKKFTLGINAMALGPNIGVPVKVGVGGVEKTFVINKADTYSMVFETDGIADTIEITPPNPTSPSENDLRKLGIGLITLKIKGESGTLVAH